MVILFLWVCSRSVRSSASQRQQWIALRSGSTPRSTPAERQGLPRCRRIGFRGAASSSALRRRPCRQPAPRCPCRRLPLAPLLATNLIRRRRVLRFGYQSGAPGPDLLTRSFGVRPFITPIHISARLPCYHLATAARTDANLSAHLRRLPTPPTYLRRMRLSPGRWRRFLIGDMAAVWLGCCSSNSPRARILVLGTSGAHWPARWPQFELTERATKS